MERNVHLPRAIEGELRRAVVDEQPLHAVEIGQPLGVVPRVAGEDGLEARLVSLQDEGPTPEQRLRALEVAHPVLDLGRQDAAPRLGLIVEKRREGLGERHPHRVGVGRLDPLHPAEQVRVGRLPERPLHGVLDVGGDELAAIDGRPGLPAHPLAQGDRVDTSVLGDGGPGREVRHQREVRRAVRGAVDELEERPAHERGHELRLVSHGGLGVEGRRLDADVLEGAAAPRAHVPDRCRGRKKGGGGRGASHELEKISSLDEPGGTLVHDNLSRGS